MVVHRNTVVTSHDDGAPVVDRLTVRDRVFDLSRVASLLAGAYFVVLGALVLLDTGLDGFPDLPLSVTFGFTQTPLLGAADVVVGLALLAGASDWERSLTSFVSATMAIAGLIILLGIDRLPAALVTNTGYGWLLLLVGAGLLLIATVIPAVQSRRRETETRVAR